MPNYVERPDVAQWLCDGVQRALDADYAKRDMVGKLHLSQTIYCLRQSWRDKQTGAAHSKSNPDDMTLMVGSAWDTLAARLHGEYIPHVVVYNEQLVTEIDALACVDGVSVVFENKTTRAGYKQPDPERWPHYIEQIAGGLILYNRKYKTCLTTGFLTVLHLIGEGKLKVWEIPFTVDELAGFELELARRAAIINGVVEPTEVEHSDWMCGYCPYSAYEKHKRAAGDCHGYGMGTWHGYFAMDKVDVEI